MTADRTPGREPSAHSQPLNRLPRKKSWTMARHGALSISGKTPAWFRKWSPTFTTTLS